jgi:probable pyridine nucleotide-disulfide oxidoreductase
VINTGTTPALPDVPGVAESAALTSETILQLERLPHRLLILGGGYVGCEFASMYALFGSQVIMLQSGSQLLHREDPDIAAEVAEILTDQGVEVRLNARATAVRRNGDGEVLVILEDGSEVDGDDLLVATGRTPVTDHLHTSADHVPYTVFITPELARVGSTETQARAQGHNVAVSKIAVSAIPRAKTLHDTTGTWKAVVDADTNLILGAALLGHNAGEVISTLQMAMLGGLRYQQVRDAVLTHPTMGEGLNLLFDALDDQRRRA